jgi:hypothetical protein
MDAKYPTAEWFASNGYLLPRELPDGRWQAISHKLFTTAIQIIEDEYTAGGRWCFEQYRDAAAAHKYWTWDGSSDPPGNWIKTKGFPGGDRINPVWAEAV